MVHLCISDARSALMLQRTVSLSLMHSNHTSPHRFTSTPCAAKPFGSYASPSVYCTNILRCKGTSAKTEKRQISVAVEPQRCTTVVLQTFGLHAVSLRKRWNGVETKGAYTFYQLFSSLRLSETSIPSFLDGASTQPLSITYSAFQGAREMVWSNTAILSFHPGYGR